MNLMNYAENLAKNIKINLVSIDFKKREQGRYCICKESKNTYIECIPETKTFESVLLVFTQLFLYV